MLHVILGRHPASQMWVPRLIFQLIYPQGLLRHFRPLSSPGEMGKRFERGMDGLIQTTMTAPPPRNKAAHILIRGVPGLALLPRHAWFRQTELTLDIFHDMCMIEFSLTHPGLMTLLCEVDRRLLPTNGVHAQRYERTHSIFRIHMFTTRSWGRLSCSTH